MCWEAGGAEGDATQASAAGVSGGEGGGRRSDGGLYMSAQ